MKTIHGIDVLTTIEELVDPALTALIVIDMQNEHVSERGRCTTEAGEDISSARAIIPNIQRLLDAARQVGVLVTYVEYVHLSRAGGNLLNGPNLWVHRDLYFFPLYQEGSWGAQTVDELAPQPGDIVFSKCRGSAFFGTGLDSVLRARGIRSLVLTGVMTGGCVLATHIDAQMHGYYPVTVADGVASDTVERHQVALTWVRDHGPTFTADEVLAAWNCT